MPRNYTVREVIAAAIEALNVKVLHYRLLNKPELYELLEDEPRVNEFAAALPENSVLSTTTSCRNLFLRVKLDGDEEAFINTSSQMSQDFDASPFLGGSEDKRWRRLREG